MENDNLSLQQQISIIIKSSTILENMLFHFYTLNLNTIHNFIIDDTNIIIFKSGNYILNFSCEFYQDSIIGININNLILYEIESEDKIISFHDTLSLVNNDIINFKNMSTHNIEVKNTLIFKNNIIKLIKI
jgi:hypothetical protein